MCIVLTKSEANPVPIEFRRRYCALRMLQHLPVTGFPGKRGSQLLNSSISGYRAAASTVKGCVLLSRV